MGTIAEWLGSLGMSEYAQRFAENDIDVPVLRHLTDQDLKELGVSLGHRRKMLATIAELGGAAPVASRSTPSPEQKPRDEAERRQLTVMFTDLVGSTVLSTRLDPEDLRAVIGAYHRCVAETVSRFGGFVAKYMGDGVLVYFGYPQAHEDDAEQAVRSGLALVEAVPRLATTAASPLQVRVGIATGLVVVGDLIGAGAAQEQAVVGETPNMAARLQSLSDPGAVVIASSTRSLTRGLFAYRDLGAVALKGFAENVAAWQVLGVGSTESRFEALRTASTPLVGRAEEIELLLRRWSQIKRGEGQVVLISGDPGTGKSRVAQAIIERLTGEPHYRLRYYCSPHHQDSALYPIIKQLERAAKLRREDTPEQRLDKVELLLSMAADDVGEIMPLFADLLSIPTGDRYRPLSLTSQERKAKTFQRLLAQVEGLAARRSVLILFEDIHWSDPSTRDWMEVLDMLVKRAPTIHVLIVMTFRPEFTPPWIGRPNVTLLSLGRLPRHHAAEMIRSVTGGKALPNEIADQIIDRTDGVPLFIEELTKTVIESGFLVDAGDRFTVTGPVAAFAIPSTLHASLLARLDRLASAREVAQIAAVLGRQFSHELISAVARIPQGQLDSALDQLVSSELILRRGTPPDLEYTFKHVLVQDAAYSTLLRSRRQQIHARIVATLEEQFPEVVATQPAVLAHHCTEADLIEKAVGYWLNAGQQSVARSATREAVIQLRKGLELLSRMPDATARQEHELDLQMLLGRALIATTGLAASEPGEAFARARQLCDQLGRPPQLAPVLFGQFAFYLIRGELEQAQGKAEEVFQLGETGNSPRWKFAGAMASGHACFYTGKFVRARAHYENALVLWHSTYRSSSPTPEDALVSCQLHLYRTLLCLGYVAQARLQRDNGLAEARRLSPYNQAFALCTAWYGDWAVENGKCSEAMLGLAEQLSTISREHGFPFYSAFGRIISGWSLGAAVDAAKGIELMLEGIAEISRMGCKLTLPFNLIALSELYGRAGQVNEGIERLAEAAKVIEATQERWVEPAIHRLRGSLLLLKHQGAAAEQSYKHALALAQRQSAKFWELLAAVDLARLWRDQGKRTEARDLLLPIHGWFTEGFDTPVLTEAKTLLEQLSA